MRRALLMLLAALSAAISATACSRAQPSHQRSVRVLSWTGTSKVFPPGGGALDIGVSTVVDPDRSVRADTWLLSKGRSSMRSMILEPNGGWMERDGKREPMPELMLKHERQQFAIYGQMQLALAKARHRAAGEQQILIKGDGVRSVDTTFLLDRQGELTEARNVVSDGDKAGAMVPQVFKFSGEVRSNGLHWPRHLELLHGNRPFFVLDIETFEAK